MEIYPTLIYINEAERGNHFGMSEYPELFAVELRAASRSLRSAPRAKKG